MKTILRLAHLQLLCCLGLLAQSPPTELRIHPVDAAGNPVKLSQAEIYLDLWGEGARIALPLDESGVRVLLDRAWLCNARPSSCEDPFVEARLILRAEGYAPMVSRAFLWIGSEETPGETPQTSVDVRFLSGPRMHLNQGESNDLTVTLHRPSERRLLFVDQAGAFVAAVAVRASLYFATSNHCGGAEGEDLVEAVSEPDGLVAIPDADAEYVLEVGKDHYALANPEDPLYPARLIGALPYAVTIVALRQLEKRPLHLQIEGSSDLAGLSLSACVAACPCGACCGPMAQSDATGHINVEDFYPEEFDRLTLTDREGRTLWQSSPRPLDSDPVVIRLPAAPLTLSEPVPLERPQKN